MLSFNRGGVTQSVRVPACQAGSRGFEPRLPRSGLKGPGCFLSPIKGGGLRTLGYSLQYQVLESLRAHDIRNYKAPYCA